MVPQFIVTFILLVIGIECRKIYYENLYSYSVGYDLEVEKRKKRRLVFHTASLSLLAGSAVYIHFLYTQYGSPVLNLLIYSSPILLVYLAVTWLEFKKHHGSKPEAEWKLNTNFIDKDRASVIGSVQSQFKHGLWINEFIQHYISGEHFSSIVSKDTAEKCLNVIHDIEPHRLLNQAVFVDVSKTNYFVTQVEDDLFIIMCNVPHLDVFHTDADKKNAVDNYAKVSFGNEVKVGADFNLLRFFSKFQIRRMEITILPQHEYELHFNNPHQEVIPSSSIPVVTSYSSKMLNQSDLFDIRHLLELYDCLRCLGSENFMDELDDFGFLNKYRVSKHDGRIIYEISDKLL